MNVSRRTALTLALSSVVATSATAADLSGVSTGSYEVDPTHAYILFSYDHLGFSSPRLAFDDFTVDLDLDVEDVTRSAVSVTIAADSVVAGSDIWKEKLVSDEFFDVANHPEITFESTAIEAGDDDALVVSGDLTIKDRTAPVTLAVTINQAMGNPRSGDPTVGLEAVGQVLRSDYELDLGVPSVSDEVDLTIAAELVKIGES